MRTSSTLEVPIFELTPDGSIAPNTVFHRAWDKLHSRCIEYPFAASRLGDARIVLDVGSAKSAQPWLAWLGQRSITVHATDVDPPLAGARGVVFHRADVRALPFRDATFDLVFAVSVLEHIGLHAPLVASETPRVSTTGDLEAFAELVRVLKPGGGIVLTFPFGERASLILRDTARAYDTASLSGFERLADAVVRDYYEYQFADRAQLYEEMPSKRTRVMRYATRLLRERTANLTGANIEGAVTWRRIPMARASARHRGHVDGVLCSHWQKRR
jgi:SAM-dependent methyltransferase